MIEEVNEKIDYIDEEGFYVIENYDRKAPFSSFLAAIAGVEGIPMWSFYVNRGQAISSIGIRDKKNCIMEFFPANEAYKMVYSNGFRTFLKINSDNKSYVIEPFSDKYDKNIKRNILIKNNQLRLVEINYNNKITIEIDYFTVPNEDFAALGRRLKVINNSDNPINIEILDGLAAILPYGTDIIGYKDIGNTLRSWMEGERKENNMALYKMRTSTGDTTEVNLVENSYFYLGFQANGKVIEPVVNPEDIFGYDTSLRHPLVFEEKGIKLSNAHISYNKVPCGFIGKSTIIESTKYEEIFSYIGYTENDEKLNTRVNEICTEQYFNEKIKETNLIIENLCNRVKTKSKYPLFDSYIEQCYIDNILRGGFPIQVGDKNKKIYYVYSRKHGDLERDYNFFSIEPNYYSQGNGNFRDVNQNRRMDIYLNPETGRENIKIFYDLIQLDGYNPLVIKGKRFYINETKLNEVDELVEKFNIENLHKIIRQKFTVGELYSELIEKFKNEETVKVMNSILDLCNEDVDSEFGEGFWTDHWTYNLDLIEEYLSIYPDLKEDLLVNERDYKFYNSPEYVLPRKDRYVLKNKKVRQYIALAKKTNEVEKWLCNNNKEIYNTNLITKLIMLAGIKFMTLDQLGIGIEMEAGKPGWNDAMNGLPGLLGSSFTELCELKRLVTFIDNNIMIVDKLQIPIEFYKAIIKVCNLVNENLSDYEYWNKSSKIREDFRSETKYYVSGEEKLINKEEIKRIIRIIDQKIDIGINKAIKLNGGNVPTFMTYNVTEYEIEDNNIKPLKFEVEFLPLFLEGNVKYLKTDLSKVESDEIYKKVKKSDIYDNKLKMYKTSETLENTTFEIGRARGFTAGWLERESIFMHMEYKYILQLLKNNLYEEFFDEIKNVLPPFMNPRVYGRSVLENSSFIASSSNPEATTHGRGFISRLSGTTVEMLNIWKIMMTGEALFKYKNNNLIFKLSPILRKEFFVDGILETTILGGIKLVYLNENLKDTFGENKGRVKSIIVIDGNDIRYVIDSDSITGQLAYKIRTKEIKKIIAEIL